MAKTWSKEEIEELLPNATAIVRQFLKRLAEAGTATASELRVPHMAAVIGHRYARARGKEPLYSTEKDEKTGKSLFSMEPKYRKPIADFLATFKAPPRSAMKRRAGRRRAGRPRKAAALAGRRPGRPRKAEAAALRPAARRGRPPKAASAPGRVDGFVRLPGDAMQSWGFWSDLVAFANAAAAEGKKLRVSTDGTEVHVEATR